MKELSKQTKFNMSIETMISLAGALIIATGFYWNLKAQISEAMLQPVPTISREEFDMKDNMIRNEVMNNRELIEKNFEKLEIIEARLYELKTN
jgi:hypothetical protein